MIGSSMKLESLCLIQVMIAEAKMQERPGE